MSPPQKRKLEVDEKILAKRNKQESQERLKGSCSEANRQEISESKLNAENTSSFAQSACNVKEKKSELPEYIQVVKFIESRADEIVSINKNIAHNRSKRSFQQVPHYMRRRAASYNPKRVPSWLKEKAAKESEKTKKSKCPSRRHRRRPQNLLAEYNRRQREYVWLETHIWFAKRFKMDKLWGYKLPVQPCDKSFRALYRGSKNYAILQDLSYFCCIELNGPQDELLAKLSLLTSSSIGLTFSAKIFLNGTHEGHCILYYPDQFPFGALGPVSFLWEPFLPSQKDRKRFGSDSKCQSELIRKLWIWCHPSLHDALIKLFIKLFEFIETSDIMETVGEQIDDNSFKTKSSNTKRFAFTSRINRAKTKLHFQKEPTYINKSVKMTLLKDCLVRHRLIGPLSQSIITDALKIAEVNVSCDTLPSTSEDKKWWEVYYKENDLISSEAKKQELWKTLKSYQSPGEMPLNIVIGLTVKDPRLDLPKNKTYLQSDQNDNFDEETSECDDKFDLSTPLTALWNQDIRNEVTATKQSESELNQMRSQCLIPGQRLELGRNESRVPVIAIQQPDYDGFAAGWDIIAPLGWSMPFWIAFIYRRARASGLRDLKQLYHEAGRPLFPYLYPDTKCGIECEEEERMLNITKHYRYPPDKRPNFQKLGILTPFFMPWKTLINEWVEKIAITNKSDEDVHHSKKESKLETQNISSISNETEKNMQCTDNSETFNVLCNEFPTYFVLRAKNYIKMLKDLCNLSRNPNKKLTMNDIFKKEKIYENFIKLLHDPLTKLKNSLILIKVCCLFKGKSNKYCGIYLLNDTDFHNIGQNRDYSGPSESIHDTKDDKKVKRSRKKYKGHREGKEKLDEKDNEKFVRPKCSGLITNCNRELFGYVYMGGYSFHSGRGIGLGCCSLVGFLENLQRCIKYKMQTIALIREQNSLQYRLVNIEIVEKFL